MDLVIRAIIVVQESPPANYLVAIEGYKRSILWSPFSIGFQNRLYGSICFAVFRKYLMDSIYYRLSEWAMDSFMQFL